LTVAAAAAVGTVSASGSAQAANIVRELLRDLNSPKGIAIGADGSVIVAQGAFGPPDPVLRYDPTAPRGQRVTELTEPFNIVDVAISPLDGTGWAIGGDLVLYHELDDGTIVPVLDIAAYQAGDLDPVDIDEPANPAESNPYGLTIAPNGDALVADAAGNDLIRVTPEGTATTVARFDIEVMSTSHIRKFPAPAVPGEAVPTTVTIGPDGGIYVGELKGFPFAPGASHVWRIEPDADGAWCSVNTPDPDCTIYKGGLTAIQDITFDNEGRLLVLSLARNGVLAFEAGFGTGNFPAATLYRYTRVGRPHEKAELLARGAIEEPGGVAVGWDGTIYVTEGMFTGGRLLQIPEP
jgi:hypothetical protein